MARCDRAHTQGVRRAAGRVGPSSLGLRARACVRASERASEQRTPGPRRVVCARPAVRAAAGGCVCARGGSIGRPPARVGAGLAPRAGVFLGSLQTKSSCCLFSRALSRGSFRLPTPGCRGMRLISSIMAEF
ncbi:UDP-GalNAc:beta-1,3-N-acetylgalactosaminyltransferase 1 isoform X2 [Lynx canadensis]|uniref:UDP-GalNAc:beta-1, 3-N-acetylgalactosaminyltransferase 1 isoform X2 n=1 Tax=Lynx canadensis TaxID=61383 RepID=UPI0013C429A0|nr:UDP-GalNAc:beta-1,3-N-acetylgalactosaminyltransferase 1 isoform X2 [Lynx canadensis]XP_040336594.1 UDP-GalNAc:beta-1,3-N-acetylgalactosaminyltransferase 1 isoform X2 [Puma yagouaroundi]